MKMKRWSWCCVTGLVVAALWGIGCEDDPVQLVDCGEGTVLADGECLPDDDYSHQCEEGEVLSADGECVDPGEVHCQGRTSWDVEAQACVYAADVECGEGTVEVDGECVVEDQISCGDDTVLFREQCVVREDVCGAGTEFDTGKLECHIDTDVCDGKTEFDVAIGECVDRSVVECDEETTYEYDGVCLPLDSFVDELADDADIDHDDGEPVAPTADDQFVFTGTLDTELSQTFDLEGAEGQWLEITVYSHGVPSPGFVIGGDDEDWQRGVTAGHVNTTPSRLVAIPADDTFELTVQTALSDYEEWDDEGHESWGYVGTVDVVDTPDPVAWGELEQVHSGQLATPEGNFKTVDVEDTDDLVFTAMELGDGVGEAVVEVWNHAGSYATTHRLPVNEPVELDVTDELEVLVRFDVLDVRGADLGYEVRADISQELGQNDKIERDIYAEEGEALIISHISEDADPVDITVRYEGEQMQFFTGVLAANQSSYDSGEKNHEFFYAPEAGTYTVEFINHNFSALSGFLGVVTTRDVPVYEVPEEFESFTASVPSEDLEEGDWRFLVVDSPGPAVFDSRIEADSGRAGATVLSHATREVLADTGGLSSGTDISFEVEEGGIYYLAARPRTDGTSGIEFDITGRTVNKLDVDEVAEETMDVELFDVIAGEFSFPVGDEATVRLVNESQEVLFEETTDEQVEFAELMPGSGQYTMEVENIGDEPILAYQFDPKAYTPFGLFSENDDFVHTFQRGALDEGEREYVVLHPGSPFDFDVDAELGSSEEARVRLWDLNERTVFEQFEIEDEADVSLFIPEAGPVALEFEAVTDIEDGYQLELDGEVISHVVEAMWFDEEEPDIVENGTEESYTLSTDECDEIRSLFVEVDIIDANSSQIAIDLHTPTQDDSIRLREDSFGSGPLSTSYPDETEPEESLDPLIGEAGNGDWTLEILNDSCCTDGVFAGWRLELRCTI